jgi:hypothetical protein
MPLIDGLTLVARVRDYADEPDEGAPDKAYITDTMIYDRITKELRRVRRRAARAGFFLNKALQQFPITSSTSAVQLSAPPLGILNVSHLSSATSRRRLQRLSDTEEPLINATTPYFWRPSVPDGSTFTIELFPSVSSGTIQVWTVAETPTVNAATQVYLTGAEEDAVVLGAAIRCYAKTGESNAYLKALYEEALQEVDSDAAQFSMGDGPVIRNVDKVYDPGFDQQDRTSYDPADFWFAP